MLTPDFSLSAYSYELPAELIAQFPPEKRGASRLLALSRADSALFLDKQFTELADLLPADCLLVANNSRVTPARLIGKRPAGGKAEFLLLTPLPLISQESHEADVNGLIKPAAKIRIGDRLQFDGIEIEITGKGEFGAACATMRWQGDLVTALETWGSLPLPPYIRRPCAAADRMRYQTVYATQTGSVAAPTAGLHFTDEICASLLSRGIEWAELSLHVGYGTFSPVRCEDIRQHEMHGEYAEIGAETAERIRQAKAAGRPVIAIGTTVARSLEGSFAKQGRIARFSGMLSPFIYPGFSFSVIDGLITNFHLPQSTLLMLVSAFIGRERILAAYARAILLGYKFFSYGDAMLILP